MTDDAISPGDSFIYMKVGMHAKESLEDIVARKQQEIDEVGYGMWGYGGPTCHPDRVRAYASEQAESGHVIRLVMEPVTSRHDREPKRSPAYSVDRNTWVPIPEGINVLGSRYALCIANLRLTEEELPLGATRVAVGPSQGRSGADYISGQVDKACLEMVDTANEGRIAPIRLEADVIAPWAVFLKPPEE